VDDASLLRRLADRAEITDTILRFARAMDAQDWPLLRSCLLPTVDVDYSDLRGEPPARVSADEFVAARARGLGALKTQHISTNHLVRESPRPFSGSRGNPEVHGALRHRPSAGASNTVSD
jgi:SnoaL-like protein